MKKIVFFTLSFSACLYSQNFEENSCLSGHQKKVSAQVREGKQAKARSKYYIALSLGNADAWQLMQLSKNEQKDFSSNTLTS